MKLLALFLAMIGYANCCLGLLMGLFNRQQAAAPAAPIVISTNSKKSDSASAPIFMPIPVPYGAGYGGFGGGFGGPAGHGGPGFGYGGCK